MKPVSAYPCISMSLELNTIILASARLVGKGDRTLVRRQHLCPYAHCGGTGRRHNTYQPSVGLTSDPVITLARWEKEAVQHAGANDTVAPILSDIGKITRKTNCNSVTHVRKLRCNKKKPKTPLIMGSWLFTRQQWIISGLALLFKAEYAQDGLNFTAKTSQTFLHSYFSVSTFLIICWQGLRSH